MLCKKMVEQCNVPVRDLDLNTAPVYSTIVKNKLLWLLRLHSHSIILHPSNSTIRLPTVTAHRCAAASSGRPSVWKPRAI
jgi:hypothetical protein